jgi:hypothetical protein
VPIYSLGLGGLLLGVSMIAQHGPMFGQFLLVFFAFYNWLPVLNPLVTILTIDDYRRGTIGIFKKQLQNQSTPRTICKVSNMIFTFSSCLKVQINLSIIWHSEAVVPTKAIHLQLSAAIKIVKQSI